MSLGVVWRWRKDSSQGVVVRGVSIIGSMVIDMNEAQVRTLEQVRQVLGGTQARVSARRG